MEQYIIDIILVLVFIAFTVTYFARGFAKTFLSAVAFAASIIISRRFSGVVSDWIVKNTRFFSGTEKYMAELIVAVVMFVLLMALFGWLISLINKVFKLPVLKQANKLLGGLLGAVSGAIFVFILVVCLQISSHMVYNARYLNAVRNSVIVQTILPEESISGGAVRENGGK